jgi:hypothetical protein
MDADGSAPLREKINRLRSELDTLSRAIKEEIDLQERWSSIPEQQNDEGVSSSGPD